MINCIKKHCILFALISLILGQPLTTYAVPALVKSTERMLYQHVPHPFYVGGSVGYGNTDWSQITAADDATTLAAPVSAQSGGTAYGAFVGYQFSTHFTLEATYVHFAQSTLQFAQDFNVYNLKTLKTNTNAYSLLGKFLVPFGFTDVYVYADAGATLVQRNDKKVIALPGFKPDFKKINRVHLGPSFGFGLAYNITPRIFSEASFQYTTGYGKADSTPVEDYIPFVYDIMFNLGLRFGSPTASGDNPYIDIAPVIRSIYIGLGLGYGNSYITQTRRNEANAAGVHYTENDGIAVDVRAGYLFVPYVALQSEYFFLPEIQLKSNTDHTTDTQSSNLITLTMKLIYPPTKKFSLFWKVGYGGIYISNPASVRGYSVVPKNKKLVFEPVLGMGVEYHIRKRITADLQYTAVVDANKKYPTTQIGTVGLNYYF